MFCTERNSKARYYQFNINIKCGCKDVDNGRDVMQDKCLLPLSGGFLIVIVGVLYSMHT